MLRTRYDKHFPERSPFGVRRVVIPIFQIIGSQNISVCCLAPEIGHPNEQDPALFGQTPDSQDAGLPDEAIAIPVGNAFEGFDRFVEELGSVPLS
jgi:hypothetical protein